MVDPHVLTSEQESRNADFEDLGAAGNGVTSRGEAEDFPDEIFSEMALDSEDLDTGGQEQAEDSDVDAQCDPAAESSEAYREWLVQAESQVTENQYHRATSVSSSYQDEYADSEASASEAGEGTESGPGNRNPAQLESAQAAPAPAAQAEETNSSPPRVVEEPWAAAVGTGEYIVEPGDSLSSIAASSGHFFKTIWNDVSNRALVQARKNPDVLLPGDRIHIPLLRIKSESCVTEKRHTFVRKGVPDKLRLRFLAEGQPLSGEAYRISFDFGKEQEGALDEEGRLVASISGKAKEATVWIGKSDPVEYQFRIGHLDPIDAVTGVQQRLQNLGYFAAEIDGKLAEQTRAAIAKFQSDQNGLTVSGKMDKATREKLQEIHDTRFQ